MRAVRLMADAILDLRSLNYPLMSPPPLPLQSMVNLCLHTSDLYAFNFALKEFAERTTTILDMEDALYGDRRGLPF